VGLIARVIEGSGIPTVCITSAWSITASANPARAVFTDFPLGHTSGRPGDVEGQLAIARAALEAVHSINEPGTIIPLPQQWPDASWRDEARELRDHRTDRLDTPQYQSEADREAAVAAHGESASCGC